MAKSGLASRLYRGEAGLDIVGRRKVWFSIVGALLLIAALSFGMLGFQLGVDFSGGNEFQVPAGVGTLTQVEDAFKGAGADVVSAQKLGGGNGQYLIRTKEMSSEATDKLKDQMARELKVSADKPIINNVFSGA